MTAVVDAMNSRWSLAAGDGVVTNTELRAVYDLAHPQAGVALQAVQAADKILARERALLSVDNRIDKDRRDKYDAAGAALRDGEARGLKPPELKPLREAFAAATEARDKSNDDQMKQFTVVEQALWLSRTLNREYGDAAWYDNVYANVSAERPFHLSFTP